MIYREMPRSGERLSQLGFGCMRLPTKSGGLMGTIDTERAVRQIRGAIDRGVNYLDTAWPYHGGKSESFLGDHVLTDGYRERVNLATKLPCFLINRTEKMGEIFEKQRKKLQTDVIDFYLLHSLDGASWDKMLSLGAVDFMDRLKKEGKIRHMGFSFHGRHEDFIRITDGYDWDFTQVQYNILDENYQAGRKGIDYAAGKGLGLIVMEPLRGGALVGRMPRDVKRIYDEAPVERTAAEWALRWLYNHEAVTVVLSGMNREDHIEENLSIAGAAGAGCLTREEVEIVERARDKYRELQEVGCTGCAYCMPCPAGIDIPAAFKELNNYHMFGKIQARAFHLMTAGLRTQRGKPLWTRACLDCGKCEDHCPQHIEIRKEFGKVRKALEGPGMRIVGSLGRAFTGRGKK